MSRPMAMLVIAVLMLAGTGTAVGVFPNDSITSPTVFQKDVTWYLSSEAHENMAGNGTTFIRSSWDDTDSDGLNNTEESWWFTNPNDWDSDGDGIADGEEITLILAGDSTYGPPFSGWPDNSTLDRDWDSVPDLAETWAIGTNPNKASTDGDKYDDGQELFGMSEASGSMPGYVSSPGNNVFVAAYPDISFDISDGINIFVHKELYIGETTINNQEFTYSTSKLQGNQYSMGTTNSHTLNNWIDVNNEQEDAIQKSEYHDSITNTEEKHWDGRTLGRTVETEHAMHATIGGEVGFLGPAPTGSISTEVGIAASVKNSIEHGEWGKDYSGKSNTINEGGEQIETHIIKTGISRGSGEESSFSTTVSRSYYTETTVTNAQTIGTAEEWEEAESIDTLDSARLRFTFFIKNVGTDMATEIQDLRFTIQIGNYTRTYPSLDGDGISIANLNPDEEHQYSADVTLNRWELELVDLGFPVNIKVEDYSLADEDIYMSVWGTDVLFEIDDGIADGDESLDTYMVPTWGNETYVNVLKRAVPITVEDNTISSINNLPITEWSWWNIYFTEKEGTNTTHFIDEVAETRKRVLLVYYKDSDHDYYSDRTELTIGTDPNNANSHPSPVLTAGGYYEMNGNNMTVTLKFSNSGNYDAYGVEARLYSPDNTTTIYSALIGGGGRVKAGETVISQTDTFIFTNNTANYTEPVIIVYYNDPQGNHKFITTVELADINDNISGDMIYEPKMVTETPAEYSYNRNNSLIISYNNPDNETIENAKIYVGYQNSTGRPLDQINLTVDLVKGNNSFIVFWNPSDTLLQDLIGETIKAVTLVTDYQGALIDEDVIKMRIVDYNVSSPELIISPISWDFSTVNQGDDLIKTFTVLNTGRSQLSFMINNDINAIICGIPSLTETSTTLVTVPSGSSSSFTIHLNTNTAGRINDNILVYSNDPFNQVISIPITGNISATPEIEPTFDLTLQYNDIVFSDNNPVNGETILILAKIHNIGKNNASNITVRYYDGDLEDGGVQIGTDQVIESLICNENETVQISWIYSSSCHFVYVEVDPEDMSPESDETNNIAYNLLNVQENPPVSTFYGNQIVLITDKNNYLMSSDISIQDNAILVIRNSTLIGFSNNITVKDSGKLLVDRVNFEINEIYALNQTVIDMRNTDIILNIFNTICKKIDILNSIINVSGADGATESDGTDAVIYIKSNASIRIINSSLISRAGDGGDGEYHEGTLGGDGGDGANSAICIFSDGNLIIFESLIDSNGGNGGKGAYGGDSGTSTAYRGGHGGDGGISNVSITTGIYPYNEQKENIIISHASIVSIGGSGGNGEKGGSAYNSNTAIGGNGGYGGNGTLLIESSSINRSINLSNLLMNIDGGMGGQGVNGRGSFRNGGQGSNGGDGGDSNLSIKSDYKLHMYNLAPIIKGSKGGNGGYGGPGDYYGGGGGDGGDGGAVSILITSISELSINKSLMNISGGNSGYGGNGRYGGGGAACCFTGGEGGDSGKGGSVSILINSISNISTNNSLLNVSGGHGGNGGSGGDCGKGEAANGRIGGDGASINISIKSSSNVSFFNSSIDVNGSCGGNGGSAGQSWYGATYTVYAGSGGMGGYNNVSVIIVRNMFLMNSSINIQSGNGGRGGSGSHKYYEGGNGGNGGSSNNGEIFLASDKSNVLHTLLEVTGGNGGIGGDGGSCVRGGSGGSGGSGSSGKIIIVSEDLNIKDTSFVENGGAGGNGGMGHFGSERGGNGGSGGGGNNGYLSILSNLTKIMSSLINSSGGEGGEGGEGGGSYDTQNLGIPGSNGVNGSGSNTINTEDLWTFDSILNQPLTLTKSANIINTSVPSITPTATSTVNIYWWLTSRVFDTNEYQIIDATVNIRNQTTNEFIKDGITDHQGISKEYLLSEVLTSSGSQVAGPYLVNASYKYQGNTVISDSQTITMSGNQEIDFILDNMHPDLSILDFDISFYPDLFAGTNVTLNVTVYNYGETGASDIMVQFFAGDPSNDGEQIGNNQIIEYLAPGASQEVQTHGILQFDTSSIFVLIDPFNGIPESNENNNIAFAAPDLMINENGISFYPSIPADGDPVTINATFLNNGSIDANNFIVSFFDGNDTLIGHNAITLPITASGGSLTSQITWDTTGKVGSHDIYVNIDPCNNIIESNENNNIAHATISVLPTSDLIPVNISFSKENPTTGQPVNITVLINNTGAATSTCNISFFDDGELIANSTVASIPSGNNTTVTTIWTAKTGVHNISTAVDPENMITESNECNNIINKTIFISIDEIYIDSGNASSDIAYNADTGYGYLDGIVYTAWGNLPHESVRYDMDGEIRYKFDNLDPLKNYHIDMMFYEGDGQDRTEHIWVDGIFTETINLTNEPNPVSINVPNTYEDRSIVVEIKRNGIGDVVVSEIQVIEIEKTYIDCGNSTSDLEYNETRKHGYVDGMVSDGWGTESHETIRWDIDGEIRYRFDNLNVAKKYQFNIVFYEADNQDREEEIWVDEFFGATVDMSDGQPHLVTVNIATMSYEDGTVLLSIKRVGGGNTVVSEIELEERTIEDISDTAPPAITFASPTPTNNSEARLSYVFVNVTTNEPCNVALLNWNGTNETMFGVAGTNFYLNKTGLSNGDYVYRVYANDTSDNWNVSESRVVRVNVTVPDTTPPASITNLQNTTGTTWINWTWTNPTDTDFNHTMVYLNGTWKTNTSNPFYNATGLSSNASYEIGAHTVDTSGNVNTTWVNQTTNITQKGDLNHDGNVTSADVQLALDIAFSGGWDSEADIDENGCVNVLDARMIMQAAAGRIEL